MKSKVPTIHPDDDTADDFLWGARAIARATNLEVPQVYNMFRKGAFGTSVRKFGHRTMGGSRRRIKEALLGKE